MKAYLFPVLFLGLSYSALPVAQSTNSIVQKQYRGEELSREMLHATTSEIIWEDRSPNSKDGLLH
ncbi:MAG: hypothetical protein M3Y50_05065 [Acidobacteriota bacterium]|nr:hypothetical protein [Acidobacteriota bacterium]